MWRLSETKVSDPLSAGDEDSGMRRRKTNWKKLTFSVVPVMTWSPSYVDFMYIPWKTKKDVHVQKFNTALSSFLKSQ